MMRQAGDPVKLRCCDPVSPDPGTVLRMPSGRRYLILRTRGKSLHCLVLAPAEVIDAPELAWFWTPRRRRATR